MAQAMSRRVGGQSRAIPVAVVGGALLLTILATLMMTSATKLIQAAGTGLVVLVIGFAATVLHPRFIYGAMGFCLGAIPFGIVPGAGQPIVLILAMAVWIAVLIHPIAVTRTSPMEITVGVLVITSLISVIITADGKIHWVEFGKWLIATSLVFALLRLSHRDLRLFGLTFIYGVGSAATFALLVFFLDKAGTTMNYLSFIGYGRTGTIGTHLRFYVLENSTVVRLTGTYVDPNAAGIFLFVGLALATAMLRGWQRLIIGGVILGALIVTLSRSAIFSAVIALLLFLIFQKVSTTMKLSTIALAIVGAAGAMTVPAIYGRIINSFSSSDKGTADRADALVNYLQSMTGSWWFGKGWGIREFTDEVVGYETNYVANSPLLTIYRGGIFVGIAFIALLIAGAVLFFRRSRSKPWEVGVLGAAFVGFALVGLQLDFPIVTHAPMTMAFSVLVAFLVVNPIFAEPDDGQDDGEVGELPERGPDLAERKVAVDGRTG